ncbi:MAG TPA: response regulator [Rhodanobacteraceae bacterium]
MINVVIVDDHDLVRAGFRMILGTANDIAVVGEARSAEEGLPLIRQLKPDVALVDVHMDGMTGLEMTERMVRAKSPTHVLILTVLDDAHFSRRLLDAGAHGYLTKGCPAVELLTAIRRVAAGQRYLGKDLAARVAFAAVDGNESPVDTLSDRELEVAMLLLRGTNLQDIGAQLSVSPKTISTYKQRLMDKLGISHILELAQVMRHHGMTNERQFAPPLGKTSEVD